MTIKLNLTIDENIVEKSKAYAARNNTSVSQLVEKLLEQVIEDDTISIHASHILREHAGKYSGKFSNSQVKQAKDNALKEKYGY